jgi:RNA polymerase sigma-70 factor (ECF subfamily)
MPAFEPDSGWVVRLRAREAAALREFLDGFGPGLQTFLARFTGSRADAEDLFQETCLRVLEGLPRYRHAGRFRAWVFSIAANAARDRLRKRAGEARGLDALRVPGAAPSADADAMAREDRSRLEAAVARLPDVQREVFLLRMHSGLAFREIADQLGCPLNTVLGRMHDAVERLKGSVNQR